MAMQINERARVQESHHFLADANEILMEFVVEVLNKRRINHSICFLGVIENKLSIFVFIAIPSNPPNLLYFSSAFRFVCLYFLLLLLFFVLARMKKFTIFRSTARYWNLIAFHAGVQSFRINLPANKALYWMISNWRVFVWNDLCIVYSQLEWFFIVSLLIKP